MFFKILTQLCSKASMSQEKLAGILDVSRQAVQKWESGTAMPDIGNLKKIASYFDVSLDYLVNGKDNRSVEEMRISVRTEPSYEKWPEPESFFRILGVEYQQCVDEGKSIQKYKGLFNAVSEMPDSKYKAAIADIIYAITEDTPQREDFPFYEPSDLEEIFANTDGFLPRLTVPDRDVLLDRIRGAWYGRICGCLLGKSLEGMKFDELTSFLKRTGNYPMNRYAVRSDLQKDDFSDLKFPVGERVYDDGVLDGMPVDDDTNYIMIAYKILERCGRDFQPNDAVDSWILLQPKNAYCTAEQLAYRNFVNGFRPPASAKYKNAYREWIGAQIRGDLFGWVNPANPKKAAEMAWRDACISHIKNGIYGEMWVSAMLAGAVSGVGIPEAIRIGLSCIPSRSRLYAAVRKILDSYEQGETCEHFFAEFHKRWDDYNIHHWCNVISNAEIVAASLLYGNGDYEKTICLAVQQGFDTDCNSATAGSVVGIILGGKKLPKKWTDKINGTLHTSLFGSERLSVDEMAEKTLQFIPE